MKEPTCDAGNITAVWGYSSLQMLLSGAFRTIMIKENYFLNVHKAHRL